MTSGGKENSTFTNLKKILSGEVGTVMSVGQDKAGKVRIDTAIALNEFYTDRNGKEEFVSAKRYEGGFLHFVTALDEDRDVRNRFDCDMLINNVKHVEADESKDLPEKAIIKGAIFDFRNQLLPVEFSVTNPKAIDYFEGLGVSNKEPVFTKVWGRQISETVVKKIVEENAFDDASIRTVKSSRKDYVITGAAKEPYLWDDETTLTVAELNEAITKREIQLATIKKRNDDYKASKVAPIATPSAFNGNEFNF